MLGVHPSEKGRSDFGEMSTQERREKEKHIKEGAHIDGMIRENDFN